MAPRPRTVSDGEILEATARAVSRVGPIRLTLADVAREAGIAPATVLQRFGSKRGLLLAFAQQGPPGEYEFLQAGESPLGALRRYAECMAGMAPTPEELANHLTFLVMDLTDPAFHALALKQFQAFQSEMTRIVQCAIEAGELKRTDPEALARLIQEMVHGALVSWAIFRDGPAVDFVLGEFDGLIGPYRA